MRGKNQPVSLCISRWLLLVLACVPLPRQAGAAQEAAALEGEKEKVSYAVGLNLGKQLRTQSIDVDQERDRGSPGSWSRHTGTASKYQRHMDTDRSRDGDSYAQWKQ
jgi:hypothetical protein